MLAPPVLNAEAVRDVVESFRPGLLIDGHEPEARVVFSGVSWDQYLDWDRALGDDRSGPRFYYQDSELEIMSTSDEHERLKSCLSDFLGDYLVEIGIEVNARGQATMRQALAQVGAEPDASWCLHGAKEFPDVVLEIALTSGGIRKLELYQRFGVPEVWFWRRGGLEVHALLAEGAGYERVSASRLLPGLDLVLLERCARILNWREARLTFRAGIAAEK